ncbi:MAG: pyridoxamine 5'-phosphate oxidase family protein [Acidimicrobiia bacterium]|nr:pyridoxamine 5'-phosphate oxidase family protein [Acidimicrobiia bacterium]
MPQDEYSTNRRARALAYLADHHVMTLATNGPAGPWAAAVFYVNRGFDLVFLSAPDTRHASDLAANPNTAAAIHEDYEDWPEIKGIQIEGSVRRLRGSERIDAVAHYAKKYPIVRPGAAPAVVRAALARVGWYELTATRCFFVDNSQGFGHRDEIELA